MNTKELNDFHTLGVATIRDLETENGILASSRKELFGFIFGRDSCITALKLLTADEEAGTRRFFPLVRKILVGLARLQGRAVNRESGEEPGKIVHDYREHGHELLTVRLRPPWYVYPDGIMRNFDSLDSTPLYLMLAARYLRASGDRECFAALEASVRGALRWMLDYGDKNGDDLFDYRMPPEREHGGLMVQNWMDHPETLFHEDGSPVPFPVAPLEVQAYGYAALTAWAEMVEGSDPEFSRLLGRRAASLKVLFNERFPAEAADGGFFLASAIDGSGRPIEAVRSSMGHVLWAAPKDADGARRCILDERSIPLVVRRLMRPDLFEKNAGIRTLSTASTHFSPDAYHNGCIWPHDTSIVAEGLDNFGYHAEATDVRAALFKAFEHFKTPIELFVYDHGYKEFHPPYRDPACREQAWSAAAMVADSLALLRRDDRGPSI